MFGHLLGSCRLLIRSGGAGLRTGIRRDVRLPKRVAVRDGFVRTEAHLLEFTVVRLVEKLLHMLIDIVDLPRCLIPGEGLVVQHIAEIDEGAVQRVVGENARVRDHHIDLVRLIECRDLRILRHRKLTLVVRIEGRGGVDENLLLRVVEPRRLGEGCPRGFVCLTGKVLAAGIEQHRIEARRLVVEDGRADRPHEPDQHHHAENPELIIVENILQLLTETQPAQLLLFLLQIITKCHLFS